MTDNSLGLLAASSVQCPTCHEMFAWLGDHGASIRLYKACLFCAKTRDGVPLISCVQSPEIYPEIRAVIAVREGREVSTGRRVFPCVGHAGAGCSRCGGRGWVLGFPPGAGRSVDNP